MGWGGECNGSKSLDVNVAFVDVDLAAPRLIHPPQKFELCSGNSSCRIWL